LFEQTRTYTVSAAAFANPGISNPASATRSPWLALGPRSVASATDRYRGKWRFDKHYYPVVAKLEDGSEEFKCAVVIDSHPMVRHWLRNLERDVSDGFWLPTSRGKFFPDFVCELIDDRILAVDYKGEHLRNPPSESRKARWVRSGCGRVMVSICFFDIFE
jgi:type III restriction enzyme